MRKTSIENRIYYDLVKAEILFSKKKQLNIRKIMLLVLRQSTTYNQFDLYFKIKMHITIARYQDI